MVSKKYISWCYISVKKQPLSLPDVSLPPPSTNPAALVAATHSDVVAATNSALVAATNTALVAVSRVLGGVTAENEPFDAYSLPPTFHTQTPSNPTTYTPSAVAYHPPPPVAYPPLGYPQTTDYYQTSSGYPHAAAAAAGYPQPTDGPLQAAAAAYPYTAAASLSGDLNHITFFYLIYFF